MRSLAGAAVLLAPGFQLASAKPAPTATATTSAATGGSRAAWELRELPWRLDALQPVLSTKTLEMHHGRHHRSYADNLGKMLPGTELEAMSLEALVRTSAGLGSAGLALFNNAAQAWNHDMQWASLRPHGGGKPPAAVAHLLERDFGSVQAFVQRFSAAATGVFGSGWTWLVHNARTGRLEIMSTLNADTPLTLPHLTALGTIDVWEHAYYVDYPAARKAYVAAVMGQLWNWANVEQRLAQARLI